MKLDGLNRLKELKIIREDYNPINDSVLQLSEMIRNFEIEHINILSKAYPTMLAIEELKAIRDNKINNSIVN